MPPASVHRSASLAVACVLAAAGLVLAPVAGAQEMAAPSASDGEAWRSLKTAIFAERPIKDGAALLKIDSPYRVQDAALVPVDIEALGPQTPERFIKTITLIVDHNPAPVVAVFHLTPENGIASVSTRIRINQYSDVRAIAETNTGELFMVSRYVKATGGCSAPALKNEEAAMAQVGKMLLRRNEVGNGLTEAKLNIKHPNFSGMQMHPTGNYFIPENSISRVEVRNGDRLVLAVDGSIGLSEDPMLRFFFRATPNAEIKVTARDTRGHAFEHAWPLNQTAAKASDAGAAASDM